MFFYLIAIAILLFFSFVFSGSETAYFSFSRIARSRLKHELEFKAKTAQHQQTLQRLNTIESLLTNPSGLLAVLLFANLLVNTTASSLFTLMVMTLANQYSLPRDLLVSIGAIVMTVLLVTVSEITPKIIAIRKPARFVLLTAWFIGYLTKVFSFIVLPLKKISDWMLKRISTYIHRHPFPTEDDLKTIIKISKDQALIAPEEEDFLDNLVDLSHRRVSEIMTPRIKMTCLDNQTSIQNAINMIYKEKLPLYSRIPVYENSIDNITGVLYLKDLATKTRSRKFLSGSVQQLTRAPYFIPENKSLSSLLEELRKKDSHIAIVIDEYGQTAGLVTLEDILESLLGEIQDEYDTTEEMPYQRINTQSYLVSGDIDLNTLDQLFDNFRQNIPKQSTDRLSGFIYHHWGRLPRKGEILTYHNFRIEIKNIRHKQINKVLITKIKQ